MKPIIKVEGVGHRGQMVAHLLTNELPAVSTQNEIDVLITIVDIEDSRLEVSVLSNNITRTQARWNIALVLLPSTVNLNAQSGELLTIRRFFDCWIPILPYEIINPIQSGEFEIKNGYLPTLRTTYWSIVRITEAAFENEPFSKKLIKTCFNGTTVWNLSVSSSGISRVKIGLDFLLDLSAEPVFWHSESRHWQVNISTNCDEKYRLNNKEIDLITENLDLVNFDLSRLNITYSYNANLSDRLLIDVLAVGDALEKKLREPTKIIDYLS